MRSSPIRRRRHLAGGCRHRGDEAGPRSGRPASLTSPAVESGPHTPDSPSLACYAGLRGGPKRIRNRVSSYQFDPENRITGGDMTDRAYVLGVGMIPFTTPSRGAPYNVMGERAARNALTDAGLFFFKQKTAY